MVGIMIRPYPSHFRFDFVSLDIANHLSHQMHYIMELNFCKNKIYRENLKQFFHHKYMQP